MIGNWGGRRPYFLHFDIAITDVLENNPGHWPGTDLESVYANYTDPSQFIIDNRPLDVGQRAP